VPEAESSKVELGNARMVKNHCRLGLHWLHTRSVEMIGLGDINASDFKRFLKKYQFLFRHR
jgi:hypothetical protein